MQRTWKATAAPCCAIPLLNPQTHTLNNATALACGFPWDLPTGIRKSWISVQALTLLYGDDPRCVISTLRYFPALSQLGRMWEITSYLLLVVGNVTWHGKHRPPPLQLLFSPKINFSELGFHEKAFQFFLGSSSFKSVQIGGAKSKSHFETNSARLLLIWKVIGKVASDHFSTDQIRGLSKYLRVLCLPYWSTVSWTNENKAADGYSALQITNTLQCSLQVTQLHLCKSEKTMELKTILQEFVLWKALGWFDLWFRRQRCSFYCCKEWNTCTECEEQCKAWECCISW